MLEETKLKVAMIEPVGGHGGLEIYDFGVCKSLSENGCDVDLYTCDQTKGDSLESVFGIKRYFKNIYGKHNIFIRLINFLKGLALTIFDLRRKKPDVVYLHVFTFSAIELLIILMAFFLRAHIFVNVHDPISFGNKENHFIKYLFGKVLGSKKVSVTTHTNFSKSVLCEIFPDIKVTLMPHSDIDFLYDDKKTKNECKTALDLQQDEQYVLFFGQIKKTKGLDVLLKSWKEVQERVPSAKLLVVGRCWRNDCSLYKTLIGEEGIDGSVVWNESYIEDQFVPYYFRAADVVVLPYTRIYSSGVLFRSMGYGTPTIVSDQEAFTQFIKDRENGWVFPTNNTGQLSDCLIEALTDNDKTIKVAKNAVSFLEMNNSWDVVGKQMSLIFRGEASG